MNHYDIGRNDFKDFASKKKQLRITLNCFLFNLD